MERYDESPNWDTPYGHCETIRGRIWLAWCRLRLNVKRFLGLSL